MIELQNKKQEMGKIKKEDLKRQATLYLWSKLEPWFDEIDLLKIKLQKKKNPKKLKH